MKHIEIRLVTNPRSDMKGVHLYIDGDKHTTFVLHDWEYESVEKAIIEAERSRNEYKTFTINDIGYWLHVAIYNNNGALFCKGSLLRHATKMDREPNEDGVAMAYRQLFLEIDGGEAPTFSYEYEDRGGEAYKYAGIV